MLGDFNEAFRQQFSHGPRRTGLAHAKAAGQRDCAHLNSAVVCAVIAEGNFNVGSPRNGRERSPRHAFKQIAFKGDKIRKGIAAPSCLVCSALAAQSGSPCSLSKPEVVGVSTAFAKALARAGRWRIETVNPPRPGFKVPSLA